MDKSIIPCIYIIWTVRCSETTFLATSFKETANYGLWTFQMRHNAIKEIWLNKDIVVGLNSFQIYVNESVSVLARTELGPLHFQIYLASLFMSD